MRHPEEIAKLGLVELLVKIREALYFDEEADDFDRARPYAAAAAGGLPTVVGRIDALFASSGLLPPHPASDSCGCPFCEEERAYHRAASQERLPAS